MSKWRKESVADKKVESDFTGSDPDALDLETILPPCETLPACFRICQHLPQRAAVIKWVTEYTVPGA